MSHIENGILPEGQDFWTPTEDVRKQVDCRVLVGGVGNPWLRDLDFGPQFVRSLKDEDWPEGVVFEDAAVAAHRVLHLLQELTPQRVVFVAGFPRGDPPGTVRRSEVDTSPPDSSLVEGMLGEAAGGVVDFDHTLVVARHFRVLPADTVIIEVEAVDTAFGTGFSPEVEASKERVTEMVRKEIDR